MLSLAGHHMRRDMTKPTKWLCAQRRFRSAWVSAQLSSCGQRRLVRLGGCPGWSESSLGAHSFCWFCHVAAHMLFGLMFLSKDSRLDHILTHSYNLKTNWSLNIESKMNLQNCLALPKFSSMKGIMTIMRRTRNSKERFQYRFWCYGPAPSSSREVIAVLEITELTKL